MVASRKRAASGAVKGSAVENGRQAEMTVLLGTLKKVHERAFSIFSLAVVNMAGNILRQVAAYGDGQLLEKRHQRRIAPPRSLRQRSDAGN